MKGLRQLLVFMLAAKSRGSRPVIYWFCASYDPKPLTLNPEFPMTAMVHIR